MKIETYWDWAKNEENTSRRKLGIRHQPMQPYSLNLQMCETGDSVGLFVQYFGVLVQNKSPNEHVIEW